MTEYEIVIEKEGSAGYQTYTIGTVCITPKYDDPQFGEDMKKEIIDALNCKMEANRRLVNLRENLKICSPHSVTREIIESNIRICESILQGGIKPNE